MKSTEDRDPSDIAFDEVREQSSTPPEVGIFPDGPSVHPSSTDLELNLEEEVSKVDETSSTNGENSQQPENIYTPENQDSNTSEIDMDDNLSGLNEFWELVESNVDNEMDKVSNLEFPLTHVDEPGVQEIERDIPITAEQDDKKDKEPLKSMESGDFERKSKSSKTTEVLKKYPQRASRNKPPNYYGWSSYNPLKWI